ncbi:hypothetical protein BSNK01_09210 [Bacillaceae bacterium]
MAKEPLRVLMVLDDLDIGGAQTHVLALANELVKRNVAVFVAGKDGPLKKDFTALGCPVYTDVYGKERFKRWIKKSNVRVIHAHHLRSALQAARLSVKMGIPFIYTIHSYSGKTLQKLLRIQRLQPTFISVSVPMRDWLKRHRIESVLIPNGIDTERFTYVKDARVREELAIPAAAPVVLYASRLQGRKAKIGKLLVEAAREKLAAAFPDMHVLIVGDGKEFEKIKKIVNRKKRGVGKPQIHLLGSRSDLPALYSNSDCVVGTGRVALEALACRRPVVAVGTEGAVGIVEPNMFQRAWELYFGDHAARKKYSKSALARLVHEVLSSPQKRAAWGKEGRRFVKKRFHISRVVDQLLATYRSFP